MIGTTSRAFGCPQRYIQGVGEFDKLPLYAKSLGKRPFFIIDKGVYSLLHERLEAFRPNMEFGFYLFEGESCVEVIEGAKTALCFYGGDVVIALGGGKCIDAAKFVSDDLDLPRIIVPTAASTDAPAAGISILYTKDGVHIKSVKLKRPSDLILLDSQIIADAPARLFSAGIGDALATYFEALANEATDSMNFIGSGYRRCRASMAIARECYDILMSDGENALLAVKQNLVTEAVENVIEANTLLSGLGFENTGCACAHGLHSGFSEIESAHALLHGEKVAFGLICQLVLENKPKELIDKIVRFLMAVDLPVHLRELNIEPTEENLHIIVEHTLKHNNLIYNEPLVVTAERLRSVILAADLIGRRYCFGQASQ